MSSPTMILNSTCYSVVALLLLFPGLNNVTLLGRVGSDPQLRGSERHPVVSLSMATNFRYRPGGPDSGQDYQVFRCSNQLDVLIKH